MFFFTDRNVVVRPARRERYSQEVGSRRVSSSMYGSRDSPENSPPSSKAFATRRTAAPSVNSHRSNVPVSEKRSNGAWEPPEEASAGHTKGCVCVCFCTVRTNTYRGFGLSSAHPGFRQNGVHFCGRWALGPHMSLAQPLSALHKTPHTPHHTTPHHTTPHHTTPHHTTPHHTTPHHTTPHHTTPHHTTPHRTAP